MNEAFFKSVHISNFKSLKDVTLSDCKRINLLIGKPNVGKSNILEAIKLLSLPFLINKAKLNELIRLDHITELFFNGDFEKNIYIKTDKEYSLIGEYIKKYSYGYVKFNAKTQVYNHELRNFDILSAEIQLDNILEQKTSRKISYPYLPIIKYYHFLYNCYKHQDSNTLYLDFPFGNNLIIVIKENKILKKELVNLFAEYGLKLLFDKGSNSLRIMKETQDGEIFSLPYDSIADTLQRVIFFKTAIASNENSILLFEEPEAHCFPPYISYFTRDVIYSETNQFFIATHSPYVLNDFLEYKREDVAIFIADFKEGQTVINRLTDEEVDEVYEYGIDVFFNYERFTR